MAPAEKASAGLCEGLAGVPRDLPGILVEAVMGREPLPLQWMGSLHSSSASCSPSSRASLSPVSSFSASESEVCSTPGPSLAVVDCGGDSPGEALEASVSLLWRRGRRLTVSPLSKELVISDPALWSPSCISPGSRSAELSLQGARRGRRGAFPAPGATPEQAEDLQHHEAPTRKASAPLQPVAPPSPLHALHGLSLEMLSG
eukprot:RCo050220